MISKDELLIYEMPEKINFEKEESRLRTRNLLHLQSFLSLLLQFPSMIDDFEIMSKRKFQSKYVTLTHEDKIYEDCDNFITKITNYCRNFNLSRNYLIRCLHEEETLATNFIIDFKKQNPYEPFVEQYFSFLDKDLKLISDFKHLPVSGPTAIYVYNGLICDDTIKSRVQKTPPSVDFVWDYKFGGKTMKFYASHKYTQGTGTAQKSQMRELETFLDHSLQSAITNNQYFVAIMDGNYYTDYTYPNYSGNPKPRVIDHIKSNKENKKCKVTTSLFFIETVLNMISCWLIENFQNNEIIEELNKINIIKSKIKH